LWRAQIAGFVADESEALTPVTANEKFKPSPCYAASGTPIEIATAFLSEFRDSPAKLTHYLASLDVFFSSLRARQTLNPKFPLFHQNRVNSSC
jgi:hypothetical protein